MKTVDKEKGARVREIRKSDIVNLTQHGFAARLGVRSSAICAIENGINDLTPSMAKAICREFHVNEEWLETGKGEMFIQLRPEVFRQLEQLFALQPFESKVLSELLDLNVSERLVLLTKLQIDMSEMKRLKEQN